MGVGTGRVAMALEGGYELMSLCASAEACMRTLLGLEVRSSLHHALSPSCKMHVHMCIQCKSNHVVTCQPCPQTI